MRPVKVVVQTVLNEDCLQLCFRVAVGGELFVAVFVNAMTPLNPAVEMRRSWWDTAVPYPLRLQPPLHSGHRTWLRLGELVVDKLHAVVRLDLLKATLEPSSA